MSRFRVLYPSVGKTTFDGGLNNKYGRAIIPDNESPDCQNVMFGAGSVETRYGFSKVNTGSVGAYTCDGLYTRRGTSSAETMVAFYNGTGYTLASTSFITIASAQSVFTTGVRVCAAQMENHIFFSTGGTTPYKYNGTDFTRHGVPQPSGTVTANSGGGGVLSGAYAWKISYVNSQAVEGNVSDAFGTFVLTAKIGSLTCLPIAPQSWGVSSRRLYRTVTSGTTFFRVATISDNTTTNYQDNIPDSTLGAVAPIDKGEPPSYFSIIYHQNRLFMIGSDGLVWYTDLNEPYTVGSLNFLTIGDQSTDFPKALGVFGNILVVFGEKTPWEIFMPDTTPANWKIIKSKSAFTSKSPFGSFEYNDKLCFPAIQSNKFVGFAALNGDQVEPTASLMTVTNVGGELKTDRIEPDMFDVQESYIGNISSLVYKNKAYIALTKASGSTTNNRVYVMDFSILDLSKKQKEAWVPWTGLNVSQFTVYAGSLYYGTSTSTGYLYKQAEGVYSDDGAAIDSYFWTKEFAGLKQEESFQKDFRFTNLLIDLAGAYNMGLVYKTNSNRDSGTTKTISLDPGGRLWGSMVWGVGMWGGGSSQGDVRVTLGGASGKRIQYKFSNQNTVNQRFKVYFQNFTYNLKGQR